MKHPIILLLISALLFTSTTLYAQDRGLRQGTVYVYGGYIITGVIEERTDGNIIIKTESGEQFEFTKQEIRKIRYPKNTKRDKETTPHSRTRKSEIDLGYKRKGYMGIVENSIGGGYCSSPMDNSGKIYAAGSLFDYQLSLINGYYTASGLFIGLGAGLDIHTETYKAVNDRDNQIQFPLLFLHLRKFNPVKKTSPYYGLSLGYIFGAHPTAMAEISSGIQIKFNRRGAFWLGAYLEYADDFNNILEESHFNISGGIKIGFSF